MQCGTSKVESVREKTERFNNYLYSVFTSSDFVLPNIEEFVKPTSLILDVSLSFEEVYQVLSTMQNKKACGPKGNGLYVLQVCVFPLIPILHHLLFQLLNNRIVPTEWKLHAITHVFKSGDMSNVKNYVLYYLSVEQYL